MRRRRIKRKALSVSLFPFLAVLICTLGVLIILLVLAVRSADVRATKDQTAAAEKQQQQKSQLSDLSFEQDKRLVEIEGLEATRPDSLKRLTGAREHRGHLESEIRELKKKAKRLGQALLAIQQTPLDQPDGVVDGTQIEKLKQQILVAQTDLKRKRDASQTNAKMTYAIVPHAGSGGTFRRPIFIECTSDALIIQPLGIRLLKADFAPPLDPGNMLDAALLAIREYWQKYDLQGNAGSPYPLLVVRPDGAETYVLARHAMTSWEDEFGYELVESDKTLDFGIKDQVLANHVQSVVDEAAQRQRATGALRLAQQRASQQRAAVGDRSGRGSASRASSQRPGLTASGPNGGFVANSDWELSSENGNAGDRVVQTGGQRTAGQSGAERNENQFEATTPSQANSSPSGSGSESTASASADSQANLSGGEQKSGTDVANPYQSLSLAKQRGKNWALPTQTPGATGYVRPIRVVCSGTELEVRSPLGVEKRIPITNDFSASVDPLVNEIWRQIESWGLSGERSYWKPELRISVVSGGELNFEKLRGALHDSGVVVKESQ